MSMPTCHKRYLLQVSQRLAGTSLRARAHYYQTPLFRVRRQWNSTSVSPSDNRGDSEPAKDSHIHDARKEPPGRSSSHSKPESFSAKMLESAATAFATIVVLGGGFAFGGLAYHKFYKWLVLYKMEGSFEPGDPVLELAAIGKQLPGSIADGESTTDSDHWIVRDEQAVVDNIVNGTEKGHYYLLIGEKGTGKSSMLLDAMQKIDGEGVSMFEAHADLEIFRVRLGKALDFEFHEDYIGSYFSERGPRESTALLDIERALNKLEKVALRRRRKVGRPLILVVNSMHLLRDDEDGRDLLELLQQRAEQWAASSLVTMIFNSDDFWVYERFKKLATRMEVIPVGDLPREQAISALQRYRARYFAESPDLVLLSSIYDRVGGRLTFLNRVAKSSDMLVTCDNITETEKRWFLNQCWILGMEMDDDVMDQQKYASTAMVLAQALVDAENNMQTYHPEQGHILPTIPLHKARQIMTRSDFIKEYDHINLFTITSTADVRADSVPMQRAFRAICSEPGFREHLEATLHRISDIEGLGRTRELVAKDLALGGKYKFTSTSVGTGGKAVVEVEAIKKEVEVDK